MEGFSGGAVSAVLRGSGRRRRRGRAHGRSVRFGAGRGGEGKRWQILKRMEEQLETAARSGDVGLIASFTRAVREARANWERAGLHEQRLQEAAGSLVPVHVFHEMRTRGVAPLAELMAQQRDFIGSRLEAAGRPRFYEAWDEWAREWNRQIDDLNAEINGLLNHV